MTYDPDAEREEQLLRAHEDFYRTLEALDPIGLSDIWVTDDSPVCILPGWPMVRGWDAVYEAWENYMQHIEGVQFIITGQRLQVFENVGVISCVQNTIRTLGDKMAYSTVNAINVFTYMYDEHKWRLSVHHASHMLSSGT